MKVVGLRCSFERIHLNVLSLIVETFLVAHSWTLRVWYAAKSMSVGWCWRVIALPLDRCRCLGCSFFRIWRLTTWCIWFWLGGLGLNIHSQLLNESPMKTNCGMLWNRSFSKGYYWWVGFRSWYGMSMLRICDSVSGYYWKQNKFIGQVLWYMAHIFNKVHIRHLLPSSCSFLLWT